MIDLSNPDDVKALKSNLRATLETPAGQEVMIFLEQLCGWFDFKETDPNAILISHGKRQVLATIKTLIASTPDQIIALTTENS